MSESVTIAAETDSQISNVEVAKDLPAIYRALTQSREEIASHLVDMDEAILFRQLAIISGTDCFMLSKPGRGKTLLDTLIARQWRLVDGRWQMSKDVVPDFLFGPPAVSSLLEDTIRRNTKGMLPEVDVATLEEIGNANGPCLDALRMLMSDRVFRNNGGEQAVPLISLTGLSNTWLSGDTIGPVWDRFVLRYELPPPTAEARRAMLETITKPAPPVTEGLLSRADVERLHVERDRLARNMSAGVLARADQIFTALEEKGIVSSFRRYKLAMAKVVPAYAILEGADEVAEPHLMALQYVLWHDPKDQRTVRKVIAKIADPLADFVADITDELADAEDTASKLPAVENAAEKMTAAVDLATALKDGLLPKLAEKIAANPSNKALPKLQDRARTLHREIVERHVMAS